MSIFLIIAAILFLLAAVPFPSPIGLGWLGAFFAVLAFLFPHLTVR